MSHKIVVVGTGYVGLVTGVCLASAGSKVVCVDIDEEKIRSLVDGRVPIYEPGLSEHLRRAQADGSLAFTTSLVEALVDADIAFIAVGTPSDEDGSADLSAVFQVARQIAAAARGRLIVVDKSTVPVGTAAQVRGVLADVNPMTRFAVLSNPEFLKEGDAVRDFFRPDRVVIGSDEGDEWARDVLVALYRPFVRTADQIICMSTPSAELTKYAANAMLATRISFMNELSHLCDEVGADITDIRKGIGSDSRIGPAFLYAGPSFGGSCFPKDIRALMRTANEYAVNLRIVEAALVANNYQREVPYEILLRHHGFRSLEHTTIGIWGLAFKPETDDIREAPALHLIDQLVAAGATVQVYDPAALTPKNREAVCARRREGPGTIEFAASAREAVRGVDALVIMTEWREFRAVDLALIGGAMRARVVVDARNIWDPTVCRNAGFVYYGIGRS